MKQRRFKPRAGEVFAPVDVEPNDGLRLRHIANDLGGFKSPGRLATGVSFFPGAARKSARNSSSGR
jgi:hypothetical protein